MLSATVPNPLNFANWVGQIKKRKMYVISTVKRPVPLQHYLYLGTNMKTKDSCYLVLDKDGKFSTEEYVFFIIQDKSINFTQKEMLFRAIHELRRDNFGNYGSSNHVYEGP